MTTALPAFIDELSRAAASAQSAEMAFRDSIAREIARHERERQFAFRRLAIARAMAGAAAGAETEEAAIAVQVATFKSELGWYGDNDHTRKVAEAWGPVAHAVWRVVGGRETAAEATGASVADAMIAFEAWYEGAYGKNYLAILDHEIPEMPVVEC